MTAIQMTQEQFAELMGRLSTRGGAGNDVGRNASTPSKQVKPERPSIEIDTTEGEWAIFEDQWLRFKRMAKLTVIDEIRDNLRQCCGSQLNKRLFDVKGPATLNAATEENLLAWIKEIAVKGVHKEVHRTQFVHLKQKQGESINSYLGRLKAEAALCDFYQNAPNTCAAGDACNCTNHGIRVSYQDDMVATQLVAGLYNSDHQAKILAESAALITLDEKLNRLLIFEKSEASLSSLAGNEAISNYTGGEYRRHKLKDRNRQQFKNPTRGGGGNAVSGGGGKSGVNDPCMICRKKHPQCAACNGYHKCTTECNLCHSMGHIRNCCPNTAINSNVTVDAPLTADLSLDEEDVVFQFHVSSEEPLAVERKMDEVSEEPKPGLSNSLSISAELLSHMEYINKRFQKMKPHDAPFLEVSCKLLVCSHANYGRNISYPEGEAPSHDISGLADTGAQVCTAGSDLLTILGIGQESLIPTIMGVKGVSRSPVEILGALFLQVSASGLCTKQIVYIARGARSLILSEKALMDLGVIPVNFPSAGMFKRAQVCSEQIQEATVEVSQAVLLNNCGCPLRTELPPKPKVIPVEKPEQNRLLLFKWILNYYKSSAFNICPHQLTPEITGPKMLIITEQGAEPVATHSPIPIPHHWKRKVKGLLDQNCALGVIEPVPAGSPTTWCSRMLVTTKKSGEPRIVVDYQPLNAVSKRETHHTPTPWNLASSIPKGMKKSILDAWNGYHSIPLAHESRLKTTFISEYGRYRYLRAPQGYTGSGDAYTKRFDDITIDVRDVARCIDDSALWKCTIEECFWHVINYIDLCGRNGVIFNPSKFEFALDIIDFAGFTVTLDSIKPCLKMMKAILEFPLPATLKGLQAWFGIVNQVAYAFAQSSIMFPFRELLQKDRKFYWDSTLDALFIKSKDNILQKIEDGVKMFDLNLHTCLATDWSKTGLGFFLLQKHCHCSDVDKAPHCGPDHWQLVFAGSRFLKDPETRYSPIEGEALAVVFALEQARMFVLGCPNLILAIDHKPLVPILNGKRLDLIKNPRLLHLKEKTLMYKFHSQHIPGPLNFAADATSRNPSSHEGQSFLTSLIDVDDNAATASDAEELHTAMVNAIRASDDEVVSWDRVKEAAATDDVSMYVCDAVENGFPTKKSEAPECLRPYYKLKDELYTLDGVPFLNGRMFIPKSLRRDILANLHSAHQGPSGMKASARHRFWWLGMDRDIDQVRSQCRDCNEKAPSNAKEPLSPLPEPLYPWQLTVMDYFDLAAVYYLVIADRYTGWPEIFRQNGKTITLVKTCRNLFAQFGVPEEIASDGGGPFKSYEWRTFLFQWGIHHRKSSANYHQSNGRAELAVKSCKRLLHTNTDGAGNLDTAKVTKALLQYRNTPIAGIGMSPAYMMFGRQLRDALPSNPSTMSYADRYGKCSNVWKEIQSGRELAYARKQAKVIERYNTHAHPLTPLSVGDSVSVQNRSGNHPLRWDRTGRIVERLENKQYLVKSDGSGRVLLRTRTHLRKINPATRDMSAYDVDSPIESKGSSDITPEPLLIPGTLRDGARVIDPIAHEELHEDAGVHNGPDDDTPLGEDTLPEDSVQETPAPQVEGIRWSTRRRNPRTILSLTHGKRHEDITLKSP